MVGQGKAMGWAHGCYGSVIRLRDNCGIHKVDRLSGKCCKSAMES